VGNRKAAESLACETLRYPADPPRTIRERRGSRKAGRSALPAGTVFLAVGGVAQTLCRSKSAVLNMVNVHFLWTCGYGDRSPELRVVAGEKPQTL
jgi:hypothetical protein